jgi:hypothetical protein
VCLLRLTPPMLMAVLFLLQRVKRQYFICHGTSNIPSAVIQAATGADVVYHKDYEHGVLYALYFRHENRKQHSTMEKSIGRLDSMLMAKNGTTRTHFTSLTSSGPGKVKSFSGRDRHDDFHFCEIFDVNSSKQPDGKPYQLQDRVSIWSLASDSSRDEGYENLVQKLVFEEDSVVDDDNVDFVGQMDSDVVEGTVETESTKKRLREANEKVHGLPETAASYEKALQHVNRLQADLAASAAVVADRNTQIDNLVNAAVSSEAERPCICLCFCLCHGESFRDIAILPSQLSDIVFVLLSKRKTGG